MYICTLHQSFNDRTCAFFHFCQTVSSVKFPQGQVQWDTPSQMSVLHHMNLILFSGYVKAPFHSPVSADFGLTFIQQKSARFLLNSFVLPFCTWELPEWWSTDIFVLEPGALAAHMIKVFFVFLVFFLFIEITVWLWPDKHCWHLCCLLITTSIIPLWPFHESFSIDFLYQFNKRFLLIEEPLQANEPCFNLSIDCWNERMT